MRLRMIALYLALAVLVIAAVWTIAISVPLGGPCALWGFFGQPCRLVIA